MRHVRIVADHNISQNATGVSTPSSTARSLSTRLHDGYQRIEQAIANGDDVSAWEDFWIDLLHQYESEVDPLLSAA